MNKFMKRLVILHIHVYAIPQRKTNEYQNKTIFIFPQDNCDLKKLAECHQRIYNTNLGHMEQPDIQWGSSVFYGLVKYLRKHASSEEREHFLKETFPAIIDLGLMIETLLPTEGIVISEQQKGKIPGNELSTCTSYSLQSDPRKVCTHVKYVVLEAIKTKFKQKKR